MSEQERINAGVCPWCGSKLTQLGDENRWWCMLDDAVWVKTVERV
jgi:hypothetical protein